MNSYTVTYDFWSSYRRWINVCTRWCTQRVDQFEGELKPWAKIHYWPRAMS